MHELVVTVTGRDADEITRRALELAGAYFAGEPVIDHISARPQLRSADGRVLAYEADVYLSDGLN